MASSTAMEKMIIIPHATPKTDGVLVCRAKGCRKYAPLKPGISNIWLCPAHKTALLYGNDIRGTISAVTLEDLKVKIVKPSKNWQGQPLCQTDGCKSYYDLALYQKLQLCNRHLSDIRTFGYVFMEEPKVQTDQKEPASSGAHSSSSATVETRAKACAKTCPTPHSKQRLASIETSQSTPPGIVIPPQTSHPSTKVPKGTAAQSTDIPNRAIAQTAGQTLQDTTLVPVQTALVPAQTALVPVQTALVPVQTALADPQILCDHPLCANVSVAFRFNKHLCSYHHKQSLVTANSSVSNIGYNRCQAKDCPQTKDLTYEHSRLWCDKHVGMILIIRSQITHHHTWESYHARLKEAQFTQTSTSHKSCISYIEGHLNQKLRTQQLQQCCGVIDCYLTDDLVDLSGKKYCPLHFASIQDHQWFQARGRAPMQY